MSRNPALEGILKARYDLDTCPPDEYTQRLREYETRLDEAIAKAGVKSVTRRELEILLADAYHEFKAAKIREERARLSRIR